MPKSTPNPTLTTGTWQNAKLRAQLSPKTTINKFSDKLTESWLDKALAKTSEYSHQQVSRKLRTRNPTRCCEQLRQNHNPSGSDSLDHHSSSLRPSCSRFFFSSSSLSFNTQKGHLRSSVFVSGSIVGFRQVGSWSFDT